MTDIANGPVVHINVPDAYVLFAFARFSRKRFGQISAVRASSVCNREQSRVRGSTRAVAISALQLSQAIFQGPGVAPAAHTKRQRG
jgi:hypothetical protein